MHKPAEPAPASVEQLEALLGPLTETSTLKLSAEGRSASGLRLLAQRALFRVLRPLWFQQHQFHAQVVAAVGATAGALRTEQRAREAVDAKMRALTARLLGHSTRGGPAWDVWSIRSRAGTACSGRSGSTTSSRRSEPNVRRSKPSCTKAVEELRNGYTAAQGNTAALDVERGERTAVDAEISNRLDRSPNRLGGVPGQRSPPPRGADDGDAGDRIAARHPHAPVVRDAVHVGSREVPSKGCEGTRAARLPDRNGLRERVLSLVRRTVPRPRNAHSRSAGGVSAAPAHAVARRGHRLRTR